MPQLDSRQAAIASLLLASSRSFASHELGSRLGLSARVIRYNLPIVRQWAARYGAHLNIEPKHGVEIVADDRVRREMKDDLAAADHLLAVPTAERLRLLIFFFLSMEGPLTRGQIERRVPVSPATISRDLSRIEPWLAGNRLSLCRRPRLGASLAGREEDRRRALITLMLEADMESVLHLALWGRPPVSGNRLSERPFTTILLHELSRWGLDAAWRQIAQVEALLGRHFSDADHLTLAISWAIASRRAQAGHVVGVLGPGADSLLGSPELLAVSTVADQLHRETGFSLPMTERLHLALEVRTSGLLPDPSTAMEPTPEAVSGEFVAIACLVAEQIGERVGEDLTHPEVLDRLAEHLSRAVDRARHGLLIHNPLLSQVRNGYPSIWLAAAEVVGELSSRIGVEIPAEEVGYVTMYMGMAHELKQRRLPVRRPQVVVVCPTGGVTAWMMVSRLRRRLPELDIAEITSIRNLSRLDPGRIDAVISTARVTCKGIAVITVSPLVREDDVQRIRALFAGRSLPTPEKA